jgi:membrane protease YdiL (CAAX protease family)
MADFTPLAAYLLLAGGLFGFILSHWGALKEYFSQPHYRQMMHPLQTVILLCVGYLGVAVFEVTVRNWARGGLGPENMGGVPEDILFNYPLTTLAVVGVVTPVLEEVLARGYFLEPFIRLKKPIVGVALSSVLFGFAHLPHAFAATLFGFGMCYLRFATGSLAVPIAAHIAINSLLLTMAYFTPITPAAPEAGLPGSEIQLVLTMLISAIMVLFSVPAFIHGVRLFRRISQTKTADQS